MEEKSLLQIIDTMENIDYWIEKSGADDDLKKKLKNAQIILIPFESYQGRKNVFPEGSIKLFQELKDKFSDKIEIAVEEDNYKEVLLHSAEFVPALMFVITEVSKSLLVSILKDYIYNWITKFPDKKVKLRVVISEKHKLIEYEGSVRMAEKIIDKIEKI